MRHDRIRAPRPPVVFSFHSNPEHFKPRIYDKLSDLHKRPGWVVAVKIRLIHSVERRVITHRRAIHLNGNQIVHRHACCFERLLHPIHRKFRVFLGGNPCFARFWINSNVSTDIKRFANQNAVAER